MTPTTLPATHTIASTTEAVTAYATLAAVLVALGVSLGPVLWRWLKRPRLEWSVGRNEPHRMAEWDGGRISGAELRIRVANRVGCRQAENVRAQLRSVWVNKPQDGKQWGNLEIDITPLVWASRRDEVSSVQQVTVIPPGGIDFALYARWDRQRLHLSLPGARRHDTNAMQGFGVNRFTFQVVITADGISPLDVFVTVCNDPKGVRVERSSAPRPDEIYSVGIYTTLDPETS